MISTIYTQLSWTSFSKYAFRFIPVVPRIRSLFLFIADTSYYLCIHGMRNIWTVSSFGLLRITLLWTFMYESWEDIGLCFSSSGSAASHGKLVYYCKKLPKHFPKWLRHFTFLPAELSGFSATTPGKSVFWTSVGVQCYLIVVWFCISLMTNEAAHLLYVY